MFSAGKYRSTEKGNNYTIGFKSIWKYYVLYILKFKEAVCCRFYTVVSSFFVIFVE